MHGDEFDGAVHCPALLKPIGSMSYHLLLNLNRAFNAARRGRGLPYWSLAASIKHRIGNAMRYVERFERAALRSARDHDVDGIVCGHIHRPAIIERDGVSYFNDGDRVENCTALTEDQDGVLQLTAWAAQPVTQPLGVQLPDAA